MRQSRFEKHTRQVLLALTVVASGAGLAAAQDAKEDGPVKAAPVLKKAKRAIGSKRLIMRSEFFESRRRHPEDETFDTARAREEAVEARNRQAATSSIEVPNTGTVWVSIGPAPIMDAQTPQDFAQPSPTTGRLTDIVIDPVDFRIYVGGAQGASGGATTTGRTGRRSRTDSARSPPAPSPSTRATGAATSTSAPARGISPPTATRAWVSTSPPIAAHLERAVRWATVPQSVGGVDRRRSREPERRAGRCRRAECSASGAVTGPTLPPRGVYARRMAARRGLSAPHPWDMRAHPRFDHHAGSDRLDLVVRPAIRISTRSRTAACWLSIDNGDDLDVHECQSPALPAAHYAWLE